MRCVSSPMERIVMVMRISLLRTSDVYYVLRYARYLLRMTLSQAAAEHPAFLFLSNCQTPSL